MWLIIVVSSDYGKYLEEVQKIDREMSAYPLFRGYNEPPTEEEFNRLKRQYVPSEEEMEHLGL